MTLSRLVPGTTGLSIDLALTLLLLIAAVTWMRGRQHLVDGFEIIVTVVVLSALIELPMILDMLPEPAQRGLLIAAACSLPRLPASGSTSAALIPTPPVDRRSAH